MGDYLNARAKLYSKSLGLSVFNIDSLNLQTFVDNKKSFIRNLELSIKNYNQYINKNILVNKYFLGAEQVLIYLKKHVNLQIPLNGSDLKNKKNC